MCLILLRERARRGRAPGSWPARIRRIPPSSETSPERMALKYRDPVDAGTDRPPWREVRAGDREGHSTNGPSDRLTRPHHVHLPVCDRLQHGIRAGRSLRPLAPKVLYLQHTRGGQEKGLQIGAWWDENSEGISEHPKTGCKGARADQVSLAISLRIQTVALNMSPAGYPISLQPFPACPGLGGLWFLPTGFSEMFKSLVKADLHIEHGWM